MKHPIDQLFNQKLSDYTAVPSVDAWDKLQLHRQQKRTTSIRRWSMGIAASIILMSAISYVVTDEDKKAPLLTIAKIPMPNLPKIKVPDVPVPESSKEINIESSGSQQAATEYIAQQVDENNNKGDVTYEVVIPTEIPKPITKLSVDIQEIKFEEAMLSKVQFKGDAIKEKTTLLDRIINTASEIKNSEGMMADLRQLKDEMVSLEFLKTKKSS